MLEQAVERALKREAKRRGVWALKLSVLGHAGFPDRLCLAPGGRVAFVELKRPGAVPRALQRWVHRRLRDLGFRVAVIDCPEEVGAFLREWLDRIEEPADA